MNQSKPVEFVIYFDTRAKKYGMLAKTKRMFPNGIDNVYTRVIGMSGCKTLSEVVYHFINETSYIDDTSVNEYIESRNTSGYVIKHRVSKTNYIKTNERLGNAGRYF